MNRRDFLSLATVIGAVGFGGVGSAAAQFFPARLRLALWARAGGCVAVAGTSCGFMFDRKDGGQTVGFGFIKSVLNLRLKEILAARRDIELVSAEDRRGDLTLAYDIGTSARVVQDSHGRREMLEYNLKLTLSVFGLDEVREVSVLDRRYLTTTSAGQWNAQAFAADISRIFVRDAENIQRDLTMALATMRGALEEYYREGRCPARHCPPAVLRRFLEKANPPQPQ